jgi:ketosteroid isomerase-like protein
MMHMTTARETNVTSAEAYYQALQERDFDGLARQLHPDVKCVGLISEVTGKEAVLEAAKQFLTLLKNLTMHATFGSTSEKAVLTYDVDFGPSVGIWRTAVLMTFKDGLIANLELFYDTRPSEKN